MNVISRLGVLASAAGGTYTYSASDYFTYLAHAEAPGSLRAFPDVQVVAQEGALLRVRIAGRDYCWPVDADRSGLGWIHQEVWAPAGSNGHAYEFGPVIIRPGDLVVDAGASEGFFTRYALERGARVLAAEPLPALVDALNCSFADEIEDGRVQVLAAALGSERGTARLEAGPTVFEGSLGEIGVHVDVVALNEILGEARVDFIKMDIEGGEMSALRGASAYLAAHKPRLAIAVYHGLHNGRDVAEIIRAARPDYNVRYRGIFALDGVPPRPFMVHAW